MHLTVCGRPSLSAPVSGIPLKYELFLPLNDMTLWKSDIYMFPKENVCVCEKERE